MIRTAILDDNREFNLSLKSFINRQARLECVLIAHSLDELYAQLEAKKTQIDILLLDISLEAINSLEHISAIKSLLPNTKIVVMTGHKASSFLLQALQAGADSYYLKYSAPAQLVETIIATHKGGAFLDPQAATSIVELFRKKDATPSFLLVEEKLRQMWDLNQRELQVLKGLLNEQTYQEIATKNNVALNTIRHYVKSLYKKANVNNKAQLAERVQHLVDKD